MFDPVPSGNTVKIPSFPLKYGTKSENVRRLQAWINKQTGMIFMKTGINLKKLKEDGIFGKNTLNAVRTAFKKDEVSKVMFEKYKM